MHYVYILKSKKNKTHYVGMTSDLIRRLGEHRRKEVKYTSTEDTYSLAWYGAFRSKMLARNFEKYLKSSSGFSFRNKRLV